MTQTITGREHRHARSRRVHRAASLLVATASALVVWTVSSPVLGIDLVAGSGTSAQRIGGFAVAVVPLIAGGGAWALLAVLEKFGQAGRRTWLIAGWAVLAISLLGPITMAQSLDVMISLLLMHLLVGTALMLGLPSTRRNA